MGNVTSWGYGWFGWWRDCCCRKFRAPTILVSNKKTSQIHILGMVSAVKKMKNTDDRMIMELQGEWQCEWSEMKRRRSFIYNIQFTHVFTEREIEISFLSSPTAMDVQRLTSRVIKIWMRAWTIKLIYLLPWWKVLGLREQVTQTSTWCCSDNT